MSSPRKNFFPAPRATPPTPRLRAPQCLPWPTWPLLTGQEAGFLQGVPDHTFLAQCEADQGLA
jgi:hypothetical protein